MNTIVIILTICGVSLEIFLLLLNMAMEIKSDTGCGVTDNYAATEGVDITCYSG